MPLFDAYVMIDWSGGNGRRSKRSDCIWIAHGRATNSGPATVSPPSRTEAEGFVLELLKTQLAEGQRVLVCADFAYGYPAGFAKSLNDDASRAPPPWRRVWRYLHHSLRDDLDTAAGRVPTNRNNRFEVANALNAGLASRKTLGPFWCASKSGVFARIPQNRPPQPFLLANGHALKSLRLTDERVDADTAFRLYGTGSVGSQVLTGIPRLERIRFSPQLADRSAVWPFETGWAPLSNDWLPPRLRVLHAEIYPSVRDPLVDPSDKIRDRRQVKTMWLWARDLDAQGQLQREFSLPSSLTPGSPQEIAVREEEGWILGSSR